MNKVKKTVENTYYGDQGRVAEKSLCIKQKGRLDEYMVRLTDVVQFRNVMC